MRKRITSLLLVLALCLTLLPTAALAEEAKLTAQEAQGGIEAGDVYTIGEDTTAQGDDENENEDEETVQAIAATRAAETGEVYQISSTDDLKAFRDRVNKGESSLNAVLTKNVSYSTNVAWESIRDYTGVFDGNGYTISLSVGGSGANNALFGSIGSGGIVQDLTIQKYNWKTTFSTKTGSIAYSNAGTIQRCQALDWTGEKNIGGIVYQNESTGVVRDCHVGRLTLSKSSDALVGGIAFTNDGLIQDCYISGKLQSTYGDTRTDLSSATAIVRTNNGTVENCYYWQYDSETAVAGTPVTDEAAFASGEVAYMLNGGKTELDSVWRQNLSGNADGAGVDVLPVTDASHGRVYYDGGTDSYYSLIPHIHGTTELTAWQQTDSLPDTSGRYYLTGNVALASGQTVDTDMTLCLNGHSVTGNVTVKGSFTLTDCGSGSAAGNVTVSKGSRFTLEDCALSGRIENNGTLTVSGGTVTASEGTAVANRGAFTMDSGTITASGGTGVANSGTLTMNGGAVTASDKGIENSGTMEVSGKAKIFGNTNGNLILQEGKTVAVGALDSTANIGITAEKQSGLTANSSIRLTSGGAAYLTRFFADDAASYGIFTDGDDLVLRLRSEHTHCICGHPADSAGEGIGDHTTHADVTFQPWTSGNTLPTEGNYYLTQNVVLNKTTTLAGTLCLNGYRISVQDGSCPVQVSEPMNLTDCAAQPGSVIAAKDQAVSVYGTANIFNGVIQGGSGAGIQIGPYSANANVAIYGGRITGSSTGAAVNNGTMHMYGGEISGNSRGVQAGGKKENGEFNGSFYLHGGKITDNHGSEGGGVYVMKYFSMDGGEVSNNTASGNGGGIYMLTGSIYLSGGKVTGNRAGKNGGGVCTKAFSNDRSVVNLSGNAEISNNYAGGRGGGVYLDVFVHPVRPNDYSNYCRLTMDGGSITGNTSVEDGGGVYADAVSGNWRTKSVVMVKGGAQITGNKKGEEDNNLYLPSPSEGVTINGDLDENADIRVSTETKPSEGSAVTIAKRGGLGTPENVTVPDGAFKADGAGGSISVGENGTVKLLPCSHSWTYTAGGARITAQCSICSAIGGSMTVEAPADLAYNGEGKAAVVTGSLPGVAATPAISYTKTGKYGPERLENGALPTDTGTYEASITAAGVTASAAYTITPQIVAAADVKVDHTRTTYDGTTKSAWDLITVTVGGTELTPLTDFIITNGVTSSASASADGKKAQVKLVGNYANENDEAVEFQWYIDPLEAQLELVNAADRRYGDGKGDVAIRVTNAVEGSKPVNVTVSGGSLSVGTHSVTAAALDNTNYKLPDDAAKRTFTYRVDKGSAPTVEVLTMDLYKRVSKTYTYDFAQALPEGLTFGTVQYTGVLPDTFNESWISKDCVVLNGSVLSVTTYEWDSGSQIFEYIVTVKSDNYEDFTMTLRAMARDKKVVRLPASDVDIVGWPYGSSGTNTPSVRNLPADAYWVRTVYTDKATGRVITPTNTTDAGVYTVTVRYESDDTVYIAAADFDINPRHLFEGDLGAPVGITLDKVYDGTTASSLTELSIAEDRLVIEADRALRITGAAEYASPNAGETRLVFTTDGTIRLSDPASSAKPGNYQLASPHLTKELTAHILQRELAFTVDSVSKTYGSSAADVRVTFTAAAGSSESGLVSGETLVQGVDYDVTAIFSKTNAGEDNNVTVTVTLKDTPTARNYKLTSATVTGVTGTITKAAAPVIPEQTVLVYSNAETDYVVGLHVRWPNGAPAFSEYDTPLVEDTDLTEATAILRDSFDGFKPSATAGAGALDVHLKTFIAPVGTDLGIIKFVMKSANCEDAVVPVRFRVMAKTQRALNVSIADWTYGSTPSQPICTAPGGAVSGPDITYTTRDGTTSYGAIAPTDAGDYTVTIRYESVNTIWSGSADFTIAPAELTVTALDKEILVGQPAPDLSKPVAGTDYKVEGLLGADVLTAVTLTYGETPDTGKMGRCAIHVSAALPNYNVTCISGTLVISKNTAPVLADIPANCKYTLTGEQTVDVSGLVPSAAGYTLGAAVGETAIISGASVDASGVVKYTLTGTGKAGDSVTLPVTISSVKYEDAAVNVVITLLPRDDQAPLRITGGTTVVYGETLRLGTSGGSGTGEVTYTVTGVNGAAVIDANGVLTPVKVGAVTVTAAKAGDNTYNDVTSAPVTITITKARPTGEPDYKRVTARGRTLQDAALTLSGSTLSPQDGTLEWLDENNNVLSDDTMIRARKTYKWRFTPADENYTAITGETVLYDPSDDIGRPDRNTVVVTVNGNGSVSPSGWASVPVGGDQTFTITPDKGYAVAKVLIDGRNVGAVTSYTFCNVTEGHTLEVIFMKANGNPQTGVTVGQRAAGSGR